MMNSKNMLSAGFLMMLACACGAEADNGTSNKRDGVTDEGADAKKPAPNSPNSTEPTDLDEGEDSDDQATDNGGASTPGFEGCAVPEVCQLCDDGETCATPEVEVVNGECGEITWVCEETPTEPGGDVIPCAIPEICQLCDDNTCARAEVEFVNGECGEITWVCDDAEPELKPEDCPVIAICMICADESCAAPVVEIVDGECGPVTWVCEDGSTPGGNAQ